MASTQNTLFSFHLPETDRAVLEKQGGELNSGTVTVQV